MQVDQEMLFEIIFVANYMDIKSWRWLQDSREHDHGQRFHLRKTFNIQNDFSKAMTSPRYKPGAGQTPLPTLPVDESTPQRGVGVQQLHGWPRWIAMVKSGSAAASS
jgi:hypothetical protein